jgi:hypothetical protein
MSPRSKRRRTRRGHRWLKVALVLALVAGGAGGAYALTRSKLFGVSRIDVVGARTLTRAAVIEASGIAIGENAMALDLGAVADRVRALDGVADARVEREGSLGIRITISERRPAVEVRVGHAKMWFDQSAHLLDLARAPKGKFPLVVVTRPAPPPAPAVAAAVATPAGTPAPAVPATPAVAEPPFDPVAFATPTVRSVLAVWRRLPADFRSSITRFDAQPDGTLVFAAGPTRVTFGAPDRIAEKIAALNLVSARVTGGGGRLVSIDLSSPSHPAARIA